MATVKNLDAPDETRKFRAHGHTQFVHLEGVTISRSTFEPGWRWTEDVKPIMQTPLCPVHHKAVVVSGHLHVTVVDAGDELDLGPGDVFDVPPGHDAWVVGSEPCVVVDVSPGIDRYAAPPE
jgi:hypothetical protein